MKKKRVVIIVVVVALLVAAAVTVFVLRKKNKIPANTTEALKKVVTTAVSGYVPEKFPLKQGMKGENVKTLQKTINNVSRTEEKSGRTYIELLKVDGYFGPATLAGYQWASNNENATEISQVDFNKFVNFANIYL